MNTAKPYRPGQRFDPQRIWGPMLACIKEEMDAYEEQYSHLRRNHKRRIKKGEKTTIYNVMRQWCQQAAKQIEKGETVVINRVYTNRRDAQKNEACSRISNRHLAKGALVGLFLGEEIESGGKDYDFNDVFFRPLKQWHGPTCSFELLINPSIIPTHAFPAGIDLMVMETFPDRGELPELKEYQAPQVAQASPQEIEQEVEAILADIAEMNAMEPDLEPLEMVSMDAEMVSMDGFPEGFSQELAQEPTTAPTGEVIHDLAPDSDLMGRKTPHLPEKYGTSINKRISQRPVDKSTREALTADADHPDVSHANVSHAELEVGNRRKVSSQATASKGTGKFSQENRDENHASTPSSEAQEVAAADGKAIEEPGSFRLSDHFRMQQAGQTLLAFAQLLLSAYLTKIAAAMGRTYHVGEQKRALSVIMRLLQAQPAHEVDGFVDHLLKIIDHMATKYIPHRPGNWCKPPSQWFDPGERANFAGAYKNYVLPWREKAEGWRNTGGPSPREQAQAQEAEEGRQARDRSGWHEVAWQLKWELARIHRHDTRLKSADLNRWAEHLRRISTQDHHSPANIVKVANWLVAGQSKRAKFWRLEAGGHGLRSASGLRRNFDQLFTQMLHEETWKKEKKQDAKKAKQIPRGKYNPHR